MTSMRLEIPLPPPLVTKKEVTRPSLDMTFKEYLVPTAAVAAISPLWAGIRSAFATRKHPADLRKKVSLELNCNIYHRQF
jgi:hypothetical protein